MRPTEFDPNAAALPGSGIFGLPFPPDECEVVLLPVPWEAARSASTASIPRAARTPAHRCREG